MNFHDLFNWAHLDGHLIVSNPCYYKKIKLMFWSSSLRFISQRLSTQRGEECGLHSTCLPSLVLDLKSWTTESNTSRFALLF